MGVRPAGAPSIAIATPAGRDRMMNRAGAVASASSRARSADAASAIFSPASSTPQISQRSRLVPITPPVRPLMSSRLIS